MTSTSPTSATPRASSSSRTTPRSKPPRSTTVNSTAPREWWCRPADRSASSPPSPMAARANGASGAVAGGGRLPSGAPTILGLNQGFGEVNLGTGGTLVTPQVTLGSGTGIFNFHGGTLVPTVDGPNFFSSATAAYIYSEGAVVDTDGHSVQIAQSLTAPSGSGVASIAVANGGSGYAAHPVVEISGGGGTGAAAVAILTNGVVTGFQITNPGV